MAKVVSKSGLAGKLGIAGAKAVKEHREDETRMGFVSLPGDIKSGVAKLIDCRFSQYKSGDNEGEYFWLAAGAVLKPEVHNGMPVKGLRTQIMIPLVETKIKSGKRAGETITVQDRIAEILNEMRKLGYDTSSLEVTDLEAACEELKESEPTFRFSTRSSKYTPPKTKANPNPETREFINESWHGAVEFDEDATAGEVVDETDDVEPAAEEPAEEPGEELDLEALGTAADAEDEEAMATLTEQAEAAGLDPNDYELWSELAAVLAVSEDVAPEDEEVVEEEPEPAVGECWKYTPKKANPKKASYDFEITAVFKAKKTVNGKNLDKKSEVVRNVPWDELSAT